MSAGFTTIDLLLASLVLLVFVGLFVFFVVRRRDRSADGSPSRAHRVGCVLLVVVALIGATLLVRVITVGRGDAIEFVVHLWDATGTGLEIFVGDRPLETGGAFVRFDDERFRIVTAEGEGDHAIAREMLPDHELLEVTEGPGGSRATPHGLTVVKTVEVLGRAPDGRLDSVVLVLVEGPRNSGPEPSMRGLLVRARSGGARCVEVQTVNTLVSGSRIEEWLSPSGYFPQPIVVFSVAPTPLRFIEEGVEPGFVVDDFVLEGGLPAPR